MWWTHYLELNVNFGLVGVLIKKPEHMITCIRCRSLYDIFKAHPEFKKLDDIKNKIG
jgi:hypothetical protein